jgi:hypothetical protein
MIEFFDTVIIPVSEEQTLEVMAFMDAADESKNNGGRPVELETFMNRAKNAKGRLKL